MSDWSQPDLFGNEPGPIELPCGACDGVGLIDKHVSGDECPTCDGTGRDPDPDVVREGLARTVCGAQQRHTDDQQPAPPPAPQMVPCPTCAGLGQVDPTLPASEKHHRTRRTATDTARDTAARISPATARAVHLEILTVIANSETGLADYEIAERLNRNPSTLRARRSELMHANMVRDSGHRRRIPETTRQTIVWAITDLGRAAQTAYTPI